MRNKGCSTFLAAIFIVPVFLFLLSIYQTYLGSGYRYIQGRLEDWHIEKNGKRVINGAVLDLQVKSNFALGLQLPVEYLRCGRDGYAIRLRHENVYFILNTNNGDVTKFSSKDAFENELRSLKLFTNIRLDYSLFDTIWQRYAKYYENIDFTACRVDTELP